MERDQFEYWEENEWEGNVKMSLREVGCELKILMEIMFSGRCVGSGS
jgi:hypothetical protein